MTRCTHSGWGNACQAPITPGSALGLCLKHERAAWKFLRAPSSEREWGLPCTQCRRAPPSGKLRLCSTCYAQHQKALKEKRKASKK